jgi:HK97 family phage prohead protease
VHLVIDHDTRYVLARTKNNSLELREDPYGLHMWARMAKTTYAEDLAMLMEGGYVDQMSFACDIGSGMDRRRRRQHHAHDPRGRRALRRHDLRAGSVPADRRTTCRQPEGRWR